MDFRLMALNIREFCPVLSAPVIKQRINVRYQQMLGKQDWEFAKDSTTIQLAGIHSSLTGETVAITAASADVVGTGTTFVAGFIGTHFRFGSESQPYVVYSVTSTTQLALETNYGGSTDLATSDYSQYKSIYSPSVGDVAEITSIVYQDELTETTEKALNKLDPERTSTGAPQKWRVFSKSTALGIVSFEIWPIPDQDYVVTVYYKKLISNLSAGTDTPVFRSEVLEAGALWDCYRMSFAITQNPVYIGLARDAKTDYENLIRDTMIEDLKTTSLPARVRDVSEPDTYDDTFALSHDVD